jgi:hypothetical protein
MVASSIPFDLLPPWTLVSLPRAGLSTLACCLSPPSRCCAGGLGTSITLTAALVAEPLHRHCSIVAVHR